MPKYKQGSGSVYQRGKIWWLSYYVNGKHACESARTKDKSIARGLLQSRLGQIAEGKFVGLRPDRITFAELVDDFLEDYRINSKRSLKDAERSASVLRHAFGARRAQSVTSSDIVRYVSSRQSAGLSNASINRELSALKRMFNLGLRDGKILHKPHIAMLEERNIRKGFFEWQDFTKIRKELPKYLRAPMTFAYLTGWRVRSEVLRLCWNNIDFGPGTVRLEPETTKNREGRLIYMTPELRALLNDQRKKTKAFQLTAKRIVQLVFHNQGRAIVNYYKAWHKASKQAKLPERIPHDFRRTAVRNMVRAGIPERVAMQMSGHKTRAVFDRYHIVSDTDLREAAAKLSSAQLATILATVDPKTQPKDRQVSDFSQQATLAQLVEQLIRNQ